MLPPFKDAVPLLEIIESHGYEAYFVGGSVRDSILGKTISDVDIATSALPEELKKIFPHTVDIGIEHGTILVLFNKTPYEITTFRSESGYSDFRRPDQVQFIRSLTEDLSRRDFTMNAIAMDRKGRLIDPFQGKKAIQDKRIVTVGDPLERFSEDALRMMRAVRFVSQLGFKIEEKTYEGLKKIAPLLEKIAVERKLVEFEKLLAGKFMDQALRHLNDTGLIRYLPGLAGKEKELDKLASCKGSQLPFEEVWTLLLFHLGYTEGEAAGFLRMWKLPLKKIKQCQKLLSWLYFRMEHSWNLYSAYQAGIDVMLASERLFQGLTKREHLRDSELVKLYQSLPIKSRSELVVTGNDLLSWIDREPGPWIKSILDQIEVKVVNGELANDKDVIKEWLKECNPK